MTTYQVTEVRAGSDYLWMRLTNGQNRQTPLRSVRWFSQTPESHAPAPPFPGCRDPGVGASR